MIFKTSVFISSFKTQDYTIKDKNNDEVEDKYLKHPDQGLPAGPGPPSVSPLLDTFSKGVSLSVILPVNLTPRHGQ